MNFRLNEQLKNLDQKNSNCKYQMSAVKSIIRDKNNEITNLKEELISVEFFKNDKDKFSTQIKFLEDKLKNCKEDLEKKTKRLREVEKQNTEFRLKSDEYFIENQLIKSDNPHKAYVEMLNEKQRIIRNLEKEILILKNEVAKFDRNFDVVLTQSKNDDSVKNQQDENNFNDVCKNENNSSALIEGKKEIENLDRGDNQEQNLKGIYSSAFEYFLLLHNLNLSFFETFLK